jgi:hypothetical protein
MVYSRFTLLLVAVVLQLVSVRGDAAVPQIKKRDITPNPPNGHWIDTWTSMPQLTEPANLPPAPFVRDSLQPNEGRFNTAAEPIRRRLR